MADVLIPQYVVNWVLGAFLVLLGWWLNQVTTNMKELGTKVHSVELLVTGKYALSEELTEMRREAAKDREELTKRLMFIIELLERKVDK